MILNISFIDGTTAMFPIANKKEATNFKPYLDATVKQAIIVKNGQLLNWLKK